MQAVSVKNKKEDKDKARMEGGGFSRLLKFNALPTKTLE
jgi:hypothetical protein